MSLESAREWFIWIHDSANKEAFDQLQTYPKVEEKLAYAKKLGFEFTSDEYVAAAKAAFEASTKDMTDEELESAAGGAGIAGIDWLNWEGMASAAVYGSPGGFGPGGSKLPWGQ